MTENYIQYAGVSKENIDETDIEKQYLTFD
jgi:hypothetical protein